MADDNKPKGEFSVNLWESHPDNENDDCSTGADFDTLAEARACVANLGGTFNMVYYSNTPFVELDGPGVHEVHQRPGVAKRARQEDRMDRSEQGMGLGIHAFNEAMGCDSEECPQGEDALRRYDPSMNQDYQEHLRDRRREVEG